MAQSPVCTRDDPTEEDHAMEDWAPTPFLEWPGEIRNRVYEFYAAGITSLGINRDGTASAPPLMQVNQQVRREMGKLVSHELASTAVSFNAVAAGFNFDHILRFLERMKSDSAAPVRDLNIAVKFTRYCIDRKELNNMFRWINAPTCVWYIDERHPKETDDDYATRQSEPCWCHRYIFEIGGQAYRLRFENKTDATKVKLAADCGSFQLLKARFRCRWWQLAGYAPSHRLGFFVYECFQKPIDHKRLIPINHAGFHGVSKDRRPCAKYSNTGVLRKDTFVRTSRPRPRSEALLRWHGKRQRESADVTLAKLAGTLSLRDGCGAHLEDTTMGVLQQLF